MNKKILIAGLTSLLVLTSGGVVYQAYASDVVTKEEVYTQAAVQEEIAPITMLQTEERIAPDPNVEQIGVDLSEIPEGELILPQFVELSSNKASISSVSTPKLEQTSINAIKLDDKLSISATYQTQDGTEYLVLQNPILTDVTTTIDQIKNFYNEPVQSTEVNSEPAVYVDGTARRVVHFFVNDYSLVVSTYDGTIEEALNIANEIAKAE